MKCVEIVSRLIDLFKRSTDRFYLPKYRRAAWRVKMYHDVLANTPTEIHEEYDIRSVISHLDEDRKRYFKRLSSVAQNQLIIEKLS